MSAMSDTYIKIISITQLHEVLGFAKPLHPLISLIDASEYRTPISAIGQKVVTDLYWIALKDKSCGFDYGRNHYDFEEGVLTFTAPGQVITVSADPEPQANTGWMLFFHPDLIRTSPLGAQIDDYSFFGYEVHEALHLSEAEEQILTDCVWKIEQEYHQRIDNHTQRVIVSSLELLLNYSLRFYERQFNTRTTRHKDVVTQFERELKQYFQSEQHLSNGLPDIAYFAAKAHLSTHYFSDLLKKETGRSAKDHINDFVIEKAKSLLLSSQSSISEIAYDLGFNYPHYFTRLFKAKTGMTPLQYRSAR
jgi:AraC-like DNA-binding protein